ncbi:MAG: hypothetical protein OXC91_02985 [Rhodobacteraceae bacterium]|nr:hypothetical protein [Paracoccaceae bacterium]
MALGKQWRVRVLADHLTGESHAGLKGLQGSDRRASMLEVAIKIAGTEDISGQRILLLDDHLCRSGATLNVCCRLPEQEAGVGDVSVLTKTKTRIHR